MKLFIYSAAAILALTAVLYLTKHGEKFGKKRAYLIVLYSMLFFSTIFLGADSFITRLEGFWPSGLFAAIIASDISSLTIPLAGTGEVTLTLTNRGSFPWDSTAENNPVLLSWHLLSEHGAMIRFENPRTPFPHPILPGYSVNVVASISPASDGIPSGRFIFEFDLVSENAAWFADRGSATLRLPAEILP